MHILGTLTTDIYDNHLNSPQLANYKTVILTYLLTNLKIAIVR